MSALMLMHSATPAFAAPQIPFGTPAATQVRFTRTLMMSEAEVKTTSGPEVTTQEAGVVVPTGGASAAAATTATPQEFVDAGKFGPSRSTTATWNPQSLTVPKLPAQAKLFEQQFAPEYLKVTPDYLDGALPGDQGFDPWALAVLANPTLSADALTALDKTSRTATERDERMRSLSTEEQRAKLLWMRSSEVKHGRLAMLAAAGWPMAELLNGGFLREGYTNGRVRALVSTPRHLGHISPCFLCLSC